MMKDVLVWSLGEVWTTFYFLDRSQWRIRKKQLSSFLLEMCLNRLLLLFAALLCVCPGVDYTQPHTCQSKERERETDEPVRVLSIHHESIDRRRIDQLTRKLPRQLAACLANQLPFWAIQTLCAPFFMSDLFRCASWLSSAIPAARRETPETSFPSNHFLLFCFYARMDWIIPCRLSSFILFTFVVVRYKCDDGSFLITRNVVMATLIQRRSTWRHFWIKSEWKFITLLIWKDIRKSVHLF